MYREELARIKRIKLWKHWLQGWRQVCTQEPPKFAIAQAVPIISRLVEREEEDGQKAAQHEGAAMAKAMEII